MSKTPARTDETATDAWIDRTHDVREMVEVCNSATTSEGVSVRLKMRWSPLRPQPPELMENRAVSVRGT